MIDVRELYYRYPKNKADTLKDVSFSVGQGEVFGFLGPSGAGKSTLQKILTGTLEGFRGQAQVMGRAIREQAGGYYEHIGVDFEYPNFYGKFTAMENLRYFSSLYRKAPLPIEPLLERMGLLADANKRVNGFSKGMKTRLGFIRCLLHDPELLFLDEPTSGLDPANARILKDMVKELQAAGKTVILTTHNMHDAAELCDRVAFIVDGEIRALDTPAAFAHAGGKTEVTFGWRDEGGAEREKTISMDSMATDETFAMAMDARKITRIHSKEPSLEDTFISLTGRRLQ